MAELMKHCDLSLLKPMMKQVYARLPFDNPAYRFLLEVIQKEQVPVLFHCSAGKDRTGFGAALILMLLGVDDHVILQDYLLSNVYRRAENAKIYASVQADTKEMAALMEVQAEYLQTALAAIIERYTSYDIYLKEQFGIDEKVRKHLQERYLYA